MLPGKNISLILRRKLFAVVEKKLQRSIVRLEQNIGNNRLIFQLRMLSWMARVLMTADVPPRPAIESALLHMSDVVGNQVIAERIALIHRAPQLIGLGIHCHPASGVADSVSIDAHVGAIGIECQDVSAVFLSGSGIRIIDVRARTYRDEH